MSKNQTEITRDLAEILLYRLEKISADSAWAHQASGIKASIAKILAQGKINYDDSTLRDLDNLITLGFDILEKVAGEIPDNNSQCPSTSLGMNAVEERSTES